MINLCENNLIKMADDVSKALKDKISNPNMGFYNPEFDIAFYYDIEIDSKVNEDVSIGNYIVHNGKKYGYYWDFNVAIKLSEKELKFKYDEFCDSVLNPVSTAFTYKINKTICDYDKCDINKKIKILICSDKNQLKSHNEMINVKVEQTKTDKTLLQFDIMLALEETNQLNV